MKLIYEGDKLVNLILGTKKIEPNQIYRPSDFAVLHSRGDEKYLYNNLTKKCWQLEGEALEFGAERRFTSGEVAADSTLTRLVADQFLVPEGKDETAAYEGFCKIARTMTTRNNGYSRYTILPTTACNARCVYCYEAGIRFVTMSDETLAQTIDFIKKTRNPKKPVKFGWFGGEPLMGEKIIDKICAAMRGDGIEYRSSMITNGSLITENIVKKMCGDWNLKRIQITLDGIEEEYNARKNYVTPYDSAYWHVLSRIKLVNEAKIPVTIRVNVDEKNIGDVLIMLQDVKAFIPHPEAVFFDLAPLFDLQASEQGWKIWDESFKMAEEILRRGYNISAHYSLKTARFNYCMADSPHSSVVIAPDGKLYRCEHVQALDSVGDIWNGVTNTALVKQLGSVEKAREQCRGCFGLPECTTFSHCPNPRVDCRYATRKRMERALNKMIDNLQNRQEAEAADAEENGQEC